MLAGGIIGITFSSPVAIPVAFASHFILDALPHYGVDDVKEVLGDWVIRTDAVLVVSFLLYLLSSHIETSSCALVGAVSAASPDFAWLW